MKILGIETSCDETAAAVVENGRALLSNVVASQIDIHAQYGGVVPEVAARSHVEVINPVINQSLQEASLTWDDIDGIAVTYAPGLIGSLLIGTLAARTLALVKNKPLYPIHHVEAHVYANFITETGNTAAKSPLVGEFEETSAARVPRGAEAPAGTRSEAVSENSADEKARATKQSSGSDASGKATVNTARPLSANGIRKGEFILPSKQPDFPLLALIVSGGHSQLVLFRDHGDYELIGRTRDDAVGEAYDKVAKIIGLPYPGGPSIAKAADKGDPYKYQLPKAKLQGSYDFSFSGLKTAVLRAVQREVGVDITFPSYELAGRLNDVQRNDFAASFQRVANETLVDKVMAAFNDHQPQSVVIAGGVAANRDLRQRLADQLPIAIEYAPMQFCTDNAAMIATLAYYQAQKVEPTDPRDLEVTPNLSMSKTAWA